MGRSASHRASSARCGRGQLEPVGGCEVRARARGAAVGAEERGGRARAERAGAWVGAALLFALFSRRLIPSGRWSRASLCTITRIERSHVSAR